MGEEYLFVVNMWWFINVCLSVIFLFSIVFLILIVFDVGGCDVGLVYLLLFFFFYIFYSISKFIMLEKFWICWFFKSLVGLL